MESNNNMTPEDVIFKSENGKPITDTMHVAKYFGRQHKNILKSVRRLIAQGMGREFRCPVIDGNRVVFQMTQKGFEAVTKTLPGVDAKRDAVLAAFFRITPIPASQWKEKCPKRLEQLNEMVACSSTSIEKAIQVRNTDAGRVIDARQLHAFINNGATDFSTWFKRRVEHCGFVINEDFKAINSTEIVENGSIPGIGRPSIEYVLTIEAAKELCMVEGNDRGRAVRRYFIEAERKFRESQQVAPTHPAIPQTFAQALRLAAEQAETIEAQQKQLAEQAPKVNFAKALEIAGESILVGQLAKLMRQNGVDTGEIRLYQWMRDNGFLHKCGSEYNDPTQRALEMGLFEVRTGTRYHPHTGEPIQTRTTLVTIKGQQYFINKLVYKTQHP